MQIWCFSLTTKFTSVSYFSSVDDTPVYLGEDEAWQHLKEKVDTKVLYPEGKNPIMQLNEIYHALKYTFHDQEGPVHNATFKVSVELDEKEFVGLGNTKKTAKMYAAINALGNLQDSGVLETRTDELKQQRTDKMEKRKQWLTERKERLREKVDQYKNRTKKNPPLQQNAIGKLNDRFRGLKYQLIQQEGPLHKAMFVIALELQGQMFVGQGNSKKRAKLVAAEKALKWLGLSSGEVEEDALEDEQKASGVEETVEMEVSEGEPTASISMADVTTEKTSETVPASAPVPEIVVAAPAAAPEPPPPPPEVKPAKTESKSETPVIERRYATRQSVAAKAVKHEIPSPQVEQGRGREAVKHEIPSPQVEQGRGRGRGRGRGYTRGQGRGKLEFPKNEPPQYSGYSDNFLSAGFEGYAQGGYGSYSSEEVPYEDPYSNQGPSQDYNMKQEDYNTSSYGNMQGTGYSGGDEGHGQGYGEGQW